MGIAKFTTDDTLEREAARKGANLIGRAGSDLSVGLFITTAAGKHIYADLSTTLSRAVRTMLTGFAEKGQVMVLDSEDELSPEQASKILGISRPMVYQRMDAGKLPFREVGTHRRVLLTDVLKLKEAEDRRQSIAAEIAADTEDLEANYAQPGQGSR